MSRQWARRETQIVLVVESNVGMVGNLQATAGKMMPEIPSLDIPLLRDPTRQSEETPGCFLPEILAGEVPA